MNVRIEVVVGSALGWTEADVQRARLRSASDGAGD